MFSAYDLKKIIPRAVFALVAVNLSWGLMEIFINGVQIIGDGAQGLILAPFQDAGVARVQLGAGGELAFATIIAGAAGAAAIGIIPVVGVAVSGLFGLLFAFGIMMLRKIMLIGLIIIAPVAIALSVFPQTESWAKKWWEWFSKLLLMYPFIMAFFGISEVAAGIISGANGNEFEKIIYQLGAVLILILPYFLVGKALSLAGGAIGKVAGMVNNKDRGIIDKTKKWEGAKVAERRYDSARGQRYGGKNFATKGLNTTLRSLRHPTTVPGLAKKEDRDSRIVGFVNQNADTMEERNPDAKNLTKGQVRLLAQIGDEKQASDILQAEARKRATADGTGLAGEARHLAALNAEFQEAKAKVGGTVDAGTQLYGLKKGVKEGHISAEEAAKGVQSVGQKLATSPGQSDRLTESLATQLDTHAGSGQSVLPSQRVYSHVQANNGTSTAPPKASVKEVEDIYSGKTALGHDKLGGMSNEDFKEVKRVKIDQVTRTVQTLATTVPGSQAHTDATSELSRHRADLLTTNHAAGKVGNSDLGIETEKAINEIDQQLEAAHTAGGLGGITPQQVRDQSDLNAANRTNAIPTRTI